MTKNKQKPSTKERIYQLERVVFGINNILGLYVEYNEDMKGFNRFIKERAEKKKAEMEKSKEESK